jgi:CRISPR/Cas system-associated endonuclease Cas1
MQAALNYATGIVAGRMTRVVIARGLDPAFGFLHDGRKPGRLSLVWDAIEPLRPELVHSVFRFAGARVFKKDDFALFEGGIVRLSAKLAREIAGVVIGKFTLPEYVKTVKMIERSVR